jgi:hypothetical protein
MSIYICGMCDEYKDADSMGCHEHLTDEYACICDCCLENIVEE